MFSGFKATKCKTAAKLCVSRIKLLRNKRNVQLMHMEREIAGLLREGKDEYAWIRVEAVYREKNLLAGYEIIELYLELIGVRANLLEKAKGAPVDMIEALTSLMYAAPRVADLPELLDVRKIIAGKFGKEIGVEGPSTGEPSTWQVNVNLRRYLSVGPPEVEQKLTLLSNIAKQHQLEFDVLEFSKGVVTNQNPYTIKELPTGLKEMDSGVPPIPPPMFDSPPVPAPSYNPSTDQEMMPPPGWTANIPNTLQQNAPPPGQTEIPVYVNPYAPQPETKPVAPPPPSNPIFKAPTEGPAKGPYTDAQEAAIAARRAADEAARAAYEARTFADQIPKPAGQPKYDTSEVNGDMDVDQHAPRYQTKSRKELQEQYDAAMGNPTKIDTSGPPSAPPVQPDSHAQLNDHALNPHEGHYLGGDSLKIDRGGFDDVTADIPSIPAEGGSFDAMMLPSPPVDLGQIDVAKEIVQHDSKPDLHEIIPEDERAEILHHEPSDIHKLPPDAQDHEFTSDEQVQPTQDLTTSATDDVDTQIQPAVNAPGAADESEDKDETLEGRIALLKRREMMQERLRRDD